MNSVQQNLAYLISHLIPSQTLSTRGAALVIGATGTVLAGKGIHVTNPALNQNFIPSLVGNVNPTKVNRNHTYEPEASMHSTTGNRACHRTSGSQGYTHHVNNPPQMRNFIVGECRGIFVPPCPVQWI